MRISVVLIFLVGFFYVGPAHACSCDTPPFELAISISDAVFSGKALEVELVENTEYPEFPHKIFTFAMYSCWKGTFQQTIRIMTDYNETACGYEFELGREYLVYSTFDQNPVEGLWTGICGRTGRLEFAEGDLDLLGLAKTVPTIPVTWGFLKAFALPE